MGHGDEVVAGLVECDVAVVADAQQLQIRRAALTHLFLQLAGIGLEIAHAAGYKGVLFINVDVVEQIGVHEIAVALVMRAGDTAVFIQVHGVHAGEIYLAGLIHLNELFVDGHRRTARGKAELGIGLGVYKFLDHIGDDRAGLVIAVRYDHFHGSRSFFFILKASLLLIIAFFAWG